MEKEKKSLYEQKCELKKTWEECFEQTLEENLSEEGMQVFWSDETSIGKADEMLTIAALLCSFEDADVSVGIVCASSNKRGEPCNVKNGTPYRVVGVPDSYIYKNEFETVEAAKEFIKNEAMHSILSVDDFLVVQVVNNA